MVTAPGTRVPNAPLTGYAMILGAFGGVLAGAAALEHKRRSLTPFDFALLAAATFKSARALARERVGSLVREPFVEEAPEAEAPSPAGEGIRRALGELVTCTRCVGTWTAAGLMVAQIAAPRFGRLLTWSLAASAANDFLQAGFEAVRNRANEGGSATAE